MNDSNDLRHWLAVLLAAFVALTSAPALAGTPIQVPVQGLLTDSEGTPVDGATEVTFRIYPDASATQALWESNVSLAVDQGLFETALGAQEELDSDIFRAHPDAHLSMTVAGDEESPRMRLGTVPTAAHAMTADTAEEAHTLQGQTPDELLSSLGAADIAFDDSSTQTGAGDVQAALEALLQRVATLEQDRQDLQAQIDSNTSAVAGLDSRISAVETGQVDLQSEIDANAALIQSNTAAIQSHQSVIASHTTAIGDLQDADTAQDSAIASVQSQADTNTQDIGSLETTTTTHGNQIAALETKTASMSATTIGGHPAVTFEGVNLHVRNGTGTTSGQPNGTGNLIVGYDEARSTGSDKSGSHNLVLGPYHNYVNYGGIVAGYNNDIVGPNASVLGGTNNVASGTTSTVLGGFGNEASGFRSSVVSGWSNLADGSYAAVLGGRFNTSSGYASTLGGGNSVTNADSDVLQAEGSVTAP